MSGTVCRSWGQCCFYEWLLEQECIQEYQVTHWGLSQQRTQRQKGEETWSGISCFKLILLAVRLLKGGCPDRAKQRKIISSCLFCLQRDNISTQPLLGAGVLELAYQKKKEKKKEEAKIMTETLNGKSMELWIFCRDQMHESAWCQLKSQAV